MLRPMLLALATRADLPTWEVDDRALHAALAGAGVAFEQPVWNDPAVDWRRFDAVLIRTTWDYQDHLPAFRAWAAAVAAVAPLCNPEPVVAWNTHKSYLRDLQRDGVPLAPTHWLGRGERPDVAALEAAGESDLLEGEVEMDVNHRPRPRGNPKYGQGLGRTFTALRDAFAVRWMKSRYLLYRADEL